MDIQKIATYGTAVAVVGTGAVVGGGQLIDQQLGGPEKRQEVQLQQIMDQLCCENIQDLHRHLI